MKYSRLLLLVSIFIISIFLFNCDDNNGNSLNIAENVSNYLEMLGKNPDTIRVGDSYKDLGVKIVDPSIVIGSLNVESNLDTTKAGKYSIIYSIMTLDSNIVSLERKVYVIFDTMHVVFEGPLTLDNPKKIYIVDGNYYSTEGDIIIGKNVDVWFINNSTSKISNGTLIINEGATFRFDRESYINIQDSGRIEVLGSDSLMVKFMPLISDSIYYWGQRFGEDITDANFSIRIQFSASKNNIFNYAYIENALTGIYIEKNPNSVIIKNSIFKNNLNYGIYSEDDGIETLENNTFVNINKYDIAISPRDLLDISENNFFQKDIFVVNTPDEYLDKSGTIPSLTYYLEYGIEISGKDSLIEVSVSPGARFIFPQDGYISVGTNTKFICEGTKEDSIIFEGEKYWGYEASIPYGILIDDFSEGAVFRYVKFINSKTAILVQRENALDISNSDILNYQYYGIYVECSEQCPQNIDDTTIKFSTDSQKKVADIYLEYLQD